VTTAVPRQAQSWIVNCELTEELLPRASRAVIVTGSEIDARPVGTAPLGMARTRNQSFVPDWRDMPDPNIVADATPDASVIVTDRRASPVHGASKSLLGELRNELIVGPRESGVVVGGGVVGGGTVTGGSVTVVVVATRGRVVVVGARVVLDGATVVVARGRVVGAVVVAVVVATVGGEVVVGRAAGKVNPTVSTWGPSSPKFRNDTAPTMSTIAPRTRKKMSNQRRYSLS
jgi:hypothetical protein